MARKVDQLEGQGARQRVSKNHRATTPRRPPNDNGQDRLVDVQEAAMMLGLKPATLYQWAYKRRIPVVKLFGRRGALRFRLQDVERLIQDSLRPAMRPTEPRSE